MSDRNAVMNAVMATLQNMTFATPINGATTWRTVSNRLRLFGDVPSDQQPAAFLVTHRELDEYRGLGLLRRRLDLGIWCYSRSDNSPGGPDLDTMMAAFETSFVLNGVDDPIRNANTLGGLVYWTRIEGRVFKDPGDLDNQTLMIVPISVEMP